MDVHQTKLDIANHFVTLSEEIIIDKITVQKLVDKAGISRQTFYYHFRDIIDVIEWLLKKNLEESLQVSLQAESSEIALRHFIQKAYDNRDLVNQLRYSKNRVEVEDLLIDTFRNYLFEVIKKYPPQLNISFADMEIALEYHTHGLIGLLLTQINKQDINLDQLAKQLSRLVREIHDFS